MSAPAALLAAGLVALGPMPTGQAFTIHDPRIVEASGIARGIASPGVYYVQNDSGDSARFFAVSATTGRVRAEFDVPDATNHDWEDLAVSRDAAGTPSVWLADIGDNNAVRDEVQIYRVDEPRGGKRVGRPDVWRLRYPDGAVNAESLFVTPHGRAYIVTKSDTGRSVVYAVPPKPDDSRVQTVRAIGRFRVPDRIPAGGPQLLVTGASLSRDGSILVMRTYLTAYLWHVRRSNVAAALRHRPTVVALPLQQQGEGVCVVGSYLYVDSEGTDQPVWRVRMPPGFRAPPPPRPIGGPATTTMQAPTSSPAPRASAGQDDSHSGAVVVVGIGLAVALAALIGYGVTRRRPRG